MSTAVRNVASLKKQRHSDVSIIIPIANPGKRMTSYGPRPLVKLGNNNVIERQLEMINLFFKDPQIILVVGHDATKIMNNTPDYIIKVENEKYEETNVIRSIGMGLRAATRENVCIIYGDLVFNEEALRFPVNRSCAVVGYNTSTNKNKIGCIITDKKVTHLDYDLPHEWQQIVYLTGKELKLMKKVAWDATKYNLFGFEALNEVLDSGGTIISYTNENLKVLDIDTSKDIEGAKEIK